MEILNKSTKEEETTKMETTKMSHVLELMHQHAVSSGSKPNDTQNQLEHGGAYKSLARVACKEILPSSPNPILDAFCLGAQLEEDHTWFPFKKQTKIKNFVKKLVESVK